MIRTILTLDIAPGEADALVETFRRLQILEMSGAQEGCLGTEITISRDRGQAIVTALWEDDAAYERWTSRPDREGLSQELSVHLREDLTASTVGQVMQVEHRVSQADGRNV